MDEQVTISASDFEAELIRIAASVDEVYRGFSATTAMLGDKGPLAKNIKSIQGQCKTLAKTLTTLSEGGASVGGFGGLTKQLFELQKRFKALRETAQHSAPYPEQQFVKSKSAGPILRDIIKTHFPETNLSKKETRRQLQWIKHQLASKDEVSIPRLIQRLQRAQRGADAVQIARLQDAAYGDTRLHQTSTTHERFENKHRPLIENISSLQSLLSPAISRSIAATERAKKPENRKLALRRTPIGQQIDVESFTESLQKKLATQSTRVIGPAADEVKQASKQLRNVMRQYRDAGGEITPQLISNYREMRRILNDLGNDPLTTQRASNNIEALRFQSREVGTEIARNMYKGRGATTIPALIASVTDKLSEAVIRKLPNLAEPRTRLPDTRRHPMLEDVMDPFLREYLRLSGNIYGKVVSMPRHGVMASRHRGILPSPAVRLDPPAKPHHSADQLSAVRNQLASENALIRQFVRHHGSQFQPTESATEIQKLSNYRRPLPAPFIKSHLLPVIPPHSEDSLTPVRNQLQARKRIVELIERHKPSGYFPNQSFGSAGSITGDHIQIQTDRVSIAQPHTNFSEEALKAFYGSHWQPVRLSASGSVGGASGMISTDENSADLEGRRGRNRIGPVRSLAGKSTPAASILFDFSTPLATEVQQLIAKNIVEYGLNAAREQLLWGLNTLLEKPAVSPRIGQLGPRIGQLDPRTGAQYYGSGYWGDQIMPFMPFNLTSEEFPRLAKGTAGPRILNVGRADGGQTNLLSGVAPYTPGWLGNPFGDLRREQSVPKYEAALNQILSTNPEFLRAFAQIPQRYDALSCPGCTPRQLCHAGVIQKKLISGSRFKPSIWIPQQQSQQPQQPQQPQQRIPDNALDLMLQFQRMRAGTEAGVDVLYPESMDQKTIKQLGHQAARPTLTQPLAAKKALILGDALAPLLNQPATTWQQIVKISESLGKTPTGARKKLSELLTARTGKFVKPEQVHQAFERPGGKGFGAFLRGEGGFFNTKPIIDAVTRFFRSESGMFDAGKFAERVWDAVRGPQDWKRHLENRLRVFENRQFDRISVLDTETTGKFSRTHTPQAIQATVRVLDPKTLQQIEPTTTVQMRPTILIQPGALGVHGITDEMAKQFPAFAEAAPALLKALGSPANTVIVGSNPIYDLKVLRGQMGANQFTMPHFSAVADVLHLGRQEIPQHKIHKGYYSQGNIMQALGLSIEGLHGAPADTAGVVKILQAFMGTPVNLHELLARADAGIPIRAAAEHGRALYGPATGRQIPSPFYSYSGPEKTAADVPIEDRTKFTADENKKAHKEWISGSKIPPPPPPAPPAAAPEPDPVPRAFENIVFSGMPITIAAGSQTGISILGNQPRVNFVSKAIGAADRLRSNLAQVGAADRLRSNLAQVDQNLADSQGVTSTAPLSFLGKIQAAWPILPFSPADIPENKNLPRLQADKIGVNVVKPLTMAASDLELAAGAMRTVADNVSASVTPWQPGPRKLHASFATPPQSVVQLAQTIDDALTTRLDLRQYPAAMGPEQQAAFFGQPYSRPTTKLLDTNYQVPQIPVYAFGTGIQTAASQPSDRQGHLSQRAMDRQQRHRPPNFRWQAGGDLTPSISNVNLLGPISVNIPATDQQKWQRLWDKPDFKFSSAEGKPAVANQLTQPPQVLITPKVSSIDVAGSTPTINIDGNRPNITMDKRTSYVPNWVPGHGTPTDWYVDDFTKQATRSLPPRSTNWTYGRASYHGPSDLMVRPSYDLKNTPQIRTESVGPNPPRTWWQRFYDKINPQQQVWDGDTFEGYKRKGFYDQLNPHRERYDRYRGKSEFFRRFDPRGYQKPMPYNDQLLYGFQAAQEQGQYEARVKAAKKWHKGGRGAIPPGHKLVGGKAPSVASGLLGYMGLHTIIQQYYRLIGAMTQSITKSAEFSIELARIQTISQQAADMGLGPLSDQVIGLSTKWGQSPTETSQALYLAISNQLHNLLGDFETDIPGGKTSWAKAYGFVDSAALFGRAAATPINESAEALASVINSYQLGAGAATQVGAEMFKTIELGRVVGPQMRAILGRVMPLAAELGVDRTEVLASIAHQTIQGMKPEESITLIGNTLLRLLKPTKELGDEMQRLGIMSTSLAVRGRGLQGFLQHVTEHSGTAAENLGDMFGRIRAIRGVSTLVGSQADRYKQVHERIKAVTPEDLQKAAGYVTEAPGTEYQVLRSRAEAHWTAGVGPELLGWHNFAVGGLGPEALINTGMGLAATGAIGATIGAAGKLTTAFAGLVNFIKPLIGLGGLGVATAAGTSKVLVPAAIGIAGGLYAKHKLQESAGERWKVSAREQATREAHAPEAFAAQIDASIRVRNLKDQLQELALGFTEAFEIVGRAYNQDLTNATTWASSIEAVFSRSIQGRVAMIQGLIGHLQTMQARADENIVNLRNEIASVRNTTGDAIFDRSIRDLSDPAKGAALAHRAQQYMDAAGRTTDEVQQKQLAQTSHQLALRGFELSGDPVALQSITGQRTQLLQRHTDQEVLVKQQARAAEINNRKQLTKIDEAYAQFTRLPQLGAEDSPGYGERYEERQNLANTIDEAIANITVPDAASLRDRIKLRQDLHDITAPFIDPTTGKEGTLAETVSRFGADLYVKLSAAGDQIVAAFRPIIDSINQIREAAGLKPITEDPLAVSRIPQQVEETFRAHALTIDQHPDTVDTEQNIIRAQKLADDNRSAVLATSREMLGLGTTVTLALSEQDIQELGLDPKTLKQKTFGWHTPAGLGRYELPEDAAPWLERPQAWDEYEKRLKARAKARDITYEQVVPRGHSFAQGTRHFQFDAEAQALNARFIELLAHINQIEPLVAAGNLNELTQVRDTIARLRPQPDELQPGWMSPTYRTMPALDSAITNIMNYLQTAGEMQPSAEVQALQFQDTINSINQFRTLLDGIVRPSIDYYFPDHTLQTVEEQETDSLKILSDAVRERFEEFDLPTGQFDDLRDSTKELQEAIDAAAAALQNLIPAEAPAEVLKLDIRGGRRSAAKQPITELPSYGEPLYGVSATPRAALTRWSDDFPRADVQKSLEHIYYDWAHGVRTTEQPKPDPETGLQVLTDIFPRGLPGYTLDPNQVDSTYDISSGRATIGSSGLPHIWEALVHEAIHGQQYFEGPQILPGSGAAKLFASEVPATFGGILASYESNRRDGYRDTEMRQVVPGVEYSVEQLRNMADTYGFYSGTPMTDLMSDQIGQQFLARLITSEGSGDPQSSLVTVDSARQLEIMPEYETTLTDQSEQTLSTSIGAATQSLQQLSPSADAATQSLGAVGSAATHAASILASIGLQKETAQGELIQRYAAGGDVVNAALTPGEFVINPRATQQWYPAIQAMNRFDQPRFAQGGDVTNVGDVIVNINSTGTNNINGRHLANAIRRELRTKTARLS